MEKEITLIFPPTSFIHRAKKEALINKLKLKAYNLWTSYIQKKFGPSTDLHKVFPLKTNPISLGLLCLSTYLKKRGIKVNYIHCDYWLHKRKLSWKELLRFIVQQTSISNVCGIYSTTPTISYTLQIAQVIKKHSPKTIIVVGGPHVTFTDIETINQHPYIDFVVRGEGEETLYEIVKNSDQIEKMKVEIKGTTYRCKGIAKRAPDRPLLHPNQIPSPDFNILPKDYNLLLIDMYSRGCPFRCKFCVEHKFWKNKIRFRDAQTVVDELVQIKENFNQDIIHIADSEIDASPYHLNKLLDVIEQRKINCRYTVNLRPDAYKRINSSIINRMINLGFVGFFVGIESASEHMLKRMGQNSTFSDFLKTIEMLNQNNAKIVIPYIMLGFPGETEKTLKETQEKFIELLKNDYVSFLFPKIFIPYPGTDPYRNPEKYSIKISKNWDKYLRFGFPPPFSSPYLSNKVLKTSIVNFYKEIYAILRKKSQEIHC